MAPSTNTNEESVKAYDLTSKISPFLDLHMIFPLLEYVDSVIIKDHATYESSAVASSRLSLLTPTNMVDYAMDIYKDLHKTDQIPEEYEARKEAVFRQLEELTVGAADFCHLISDEQTKNKLMVDGEWTLSGLESYGITREVIDTYKQLAKFNYECGDYGSSKDMLDIYLSLFLDQTKNNIKTVVVNEETGVEEEEITKKTEDNIQSIAFNLTSTDGEIHSVLWGKLSCSILLESWDEAYVNLEDVKRFIELRSNNGTLPPLEALQQRTWLLHWSLFVFWNNSKRGLESIIELYTSEKYMQAIQTNAPHLIRYLAAAILINKKKRGGTLKELVKTLQCCEYEDPIIQFVDALYVQFDFDSAQKKLKGCELLLATDFFLCKQGDLFMEEARVFIFENYCRIHHKIGIGELSTKLAMDENEAERWIVDLIRNASLDAKIDAEEGCVIMGNSQQILDNNVYNSLVTKTKDLSTRSAVLGQNLSMIVNEAKKEKDKRNRKNSEDE